MVHCHCRPHKNLPILEFRLLACSKANSKRHGILIGIALQFFVDNTEFNLKFISIHIVGRRVTKIEGDY